MRGHLLDPDALVRAVASGRQKGQQPRWKRVELRYVDLKAGRHLQVTAYDATQAHTSNYAAGDAARDAVDDLLDEPFGNWHVETTTQLHQVRVTKRLEAVVHTTERAEQVDVDRGHDRDKERLLPRTTRSSSLSASPTRRGGSSPAGRRSTGRSRSSSACSTSRSPTRSRRGHVRRPTAEEPLRIVDLGCGNAYLTFAAQRFLTHVRGLPVHLVGVDVKEQSREHNSGVASGSRRRRGVRGRVDRRRAARPRPRGGAGPARLRHRHRRGAGPGRRVGGRTGPRGALLPPRHRGAAAPQPHPRAVRHAHPARHPARAVRGHPDRRAAGVADAARRATGST